MTLDLPDQDEDAVEGEADDHELNAPVERETLRHDGLALAVERLVVVIAQEELSRQHEVDAHGG